MHNGLETLLNRETLIVQQQKELIEILVNWETGNRYRLADEQGAECGYIMEHAGGLGRKLLRGFLGSHRGLKINVYDRDRQQVLFFWRKFYWLFSELFVETAEGKRIGKAQRRFGIIYKKYDLYDENQRVFATIRSPLWKLWTFNIFNPQDQQVGVISKRWTGLLKEYFTDSDTYAINFDKQPWTTNQKAVILAVAVSIDFDFFENNQGRN